MCGIVGAVAERNVSAILLEGLKRLEYRGYDSAGIAALGHDGELHCVRTLGKVNQLVQALEKENLVARCGIAHTRWATHGKPSEDNAHPHISHNRLALVHNGIIENFDELRTKLQQAGYQFTSETDTEVVVHLIHKYLSNGLDLLAAVQTTVKELQGAYALGILDSENPQRIIAVRQGSPLVIGLGFHENFLASDQLALLPVTQRFIHLQEGDVADIRLDQVIIYDAKGTKVNRPIHESELSHDSTDRGEYRHFMQKEIFEQAHAISETLEGRIIDNRVLESAFGHYAHEIFAKVQRVSIVACGTSYHAGLVAKYWLESLAGIPCHVEIASEFRYRKNVVEPGALFLTISQSGETADTLAALRSIKDRPYVGSLAICNVAESSLARESELVFLTRAGTEVGVASTKAFTAQLTALLLLTLVLGRRFEVTEEVETQTINQIRQLPNLVNETLLLDQTIKQLSETFIEKNHTLFLGRGTQFPIALEGALKLKELSYIHAEAYPAGELKHGPLALVDKNMPVVSIAPNNALLEKLKSNLQEVRARGGELIVFADAAISLQSGEGITVVPMPTVDNVIAPIIYTLPLQLLSYHVAVLKGTDVDQPRNLAKSVTVE